MKDGLIGAGASLAADLDLPPVDRETEKSRAITAWSEETVAALVAAMPDGEPGSD